MARSGLPGIAVTIWATCATVASEQQACLCCIPSLTFCCLCALQFDEATHMSAERLESQLHKVKQTIEEDKQAAMATPYALIIDGRALLYALSPRLRQLFLEVRPAAIAWAGAVAAAL